MSKEKIETFIKHNASQSGDCSAKAMVMYVDDVRAFCSLIAIPDGCVAVPKSMLAETLEFVDGNKRPILQSKLEQILEQR